ncbi:MAG: excisionase family DNA-binding protein [Planctomycetaceae bacterium]
MAKKYLSIDEAASILGLTAAQVRRAIDRRELHAYKDGASFKLSEQQVEEYRRSQQADSSPEFPLLSGDQDDDAGQIDLSASDSDVRLIADEPAPKRGKLDDLVNSGSDVRLAGDSGPRLGVGRDDMISLSDSDSDVRLAESSDSDSDVRLSDALDATGEIPAGALDSDSDVKLYGADDLLGDDSDSDVKLSGGRTDSDIRLADQPSRSTKGLLPEDSDLKLINRPSAVRAGEPDSGISLDVRGSGLNLGSADSGISLELDSGISLDANDSGISLESYDSRTKAGGDDSGISLDSCDSGISLDLDDDTGPAPVDTVALNRCRSSQVPANRSSTPQKPCNSTSPPVVLAKTANSNSPGLMTMMRSAPAPVYSPSMMTSGIQKPSPTHHLLIPPV